MSGIIALVYAVSRNGVIGLDGGLPWRLPSDLKHFKAVTLGKPVIMGRKTWDSLPKKPLPGRANIVITRARGWQAEGALVAHDADQAVALAGDAPEICVIGGAEIFKVFLPLANRIYLTRVFDDVAGDTFMPEIDGKHWVELETRRFEKGPNDSAAFETVTYERRT
ncbi:dihydrofolate reductase [Aestuariivirga litoralis]|uniref:dihydrofolate reductase n=1 Tax=Aestuariivirga litoralis TaxID=2650924 RepID=UPI0018C75CCF|nr:dihydrofolate reductase [Aestuariivirga litoralis]MBG1231184.1 dihydrofolate reductase [Aestuariivirga litoralis]